MGCCPWGRTSQTLQHTHKRHHSQQCDRFQLDFCQLKKKAQCESYILRGKITIAGRQHLSSDECAYVILVYMWDIYIYIWCICKVSVCDFVKGLRSVYGFSGRG